MERRMIDLPNVDDLRRIGSELGFELDDMELAEVRDSLSSFDVTYAHLDKLEEPSLPVTYPRRDVRRPHAAENALNAWYWRCSIHGMPTGLLAGKTIAVKDSICVAGVPMMNGSAVVEGFVPDIDASVVSRVLAAGGEIVGKAVCENLSFAGNSFTADTGPVLSPMIAERSAGGSSSGCGALVSSGACDMALGCDTGGSIRTPSSMCGIVGLKATFGLVPRTGIFPMEMSLDHVGPMARNVEDVAAMLTAIAGYDGLDPQQGQVQIGNYLESLDLGAHGLRVGVLEDGFGLPESELEVDATVRSAIATFGQLGADVQSVSIPIHREATHIHTVITAEGVAALLVDGETTGTNWRGFYNSSLQVHWARRRRAQANDLPLHVKRDLLFGQFMHQRHRGRYYAKAQNAARLVQAAYDAALEDVDVLAMPTIPMKPPLLPGGPVDLEETLRLCHGMTANTRPFNVSGHPAISIPCGVVDDLPVGLMLVARRWDEATLLRTAMAFERANRVAGRPS